VRTFSASNEETVADPPAFDTNEGSQLNREARITYDWVNKIKAGQDEEYLWIAEFWSDDCPILTFSPAGRWISITNQVIAIEKLDLMESIATYAKVSFALADAGIACWREKYRYNCLRPIDYIHKYMDDPTWNTVMCPDGSGGYYTPNFPTYPSGHATFSGAAAFVLSNIFGSEYQFTDRSHEGRLEFRSKPRSFNSFQEMAEENALSRVPLGVHFLVDSEAGLDLGSRIGSRVLSLPWK
ncbi:MAG: vanadium-dependent haloperoxidase, partial [Saprospiraceae bacterium]|nr:vanadium-dependent haloperoxidase [Saprospiraceae bacterium]